MLSGWVIIAALVSACVVLVVGTGTSSGDPSAAADGNCPSAGQAAEVDTPLLLQDVTAAYRGAIPDPRELVALRAGELRYPLSGFHFYAAISGADEISPARAITVATTTGEFEPSDVCSTPRAQFFRWTDDVYGEIQADGSVIPTYQSTPVWLVSFDAVFAGASDGKYDPASAPEAAPLAEQHVVIDASTGEELLAFGPSSFEQG